MVQRPRGMPPPVARSNGNSPVGMRSACNGCPPNEPMLSPLSFWCADSTSATDLPPDTASLDMGFFFLVRTTPIGLLLLDPRDRAFFIDLDVVGRTHVRDVGVYVEILADGEVFDHLLV